MAREDALIDILAFGSRYDDAVKKARRLAKELGTSVYLDATKHGSRFYAEPGEKATKKQGAWVIWLFAPTDHKNAIRSIVSEVLYGRNMETVILPAKTPKRRY